MQDNPPGWNHKDFPRFIHHQDEGSHVIYQLMHRLVPDLR